MRRDGRGRPYQAPEPQRAASTNHWTPCHIEKPSSVSCTQGVERPLDLLEFVTDALNASQPPAGIANGIVAPAAGQLELSCSQPVLSASAGDAQGRGTMTGTAENGRGPVLFDPQSVLTASRFATRSSPVRDLSGLEPDLLRSASTVARYGFYPYSAF